MNGEPVMSAVNTASYVIHHNSTGKSKDVSINKHSSGNVTGKFSIRNSLTNPIIRSYSD